MQMMLNMIEPKDDRTSRTQRKLQVLARALSGRRPDGNQRKERQRPGLDVRPEHRWAPGPYRTVGARDLQDALKAAAERDAGDGPAGRAAGLARPSRLGHGRLHGHGGPAHDRRLQGARGRSSWIRSTRTAPASGATARTPRESISVRELGRQFVPRGLAFPGRWRARRRCPRGRRSMSGKYVIVMPYSPARSAAIRR